VAKTSLAPQKSPGEVAALGGYGALTGVLVAFGVDPTRALAISGAVAAASPYIVKFVVWYRKEKAHGK
jgi:hypothetical protein